MGKACRKIRKKNGKLLDRLETGRVEAVDLELLRETVKERMPDWLKAVRRYDDLANETGW